MAGASAASAVGCAWAGEVLVAAGVLLDFSSATLASALLATACRSTVSRLLSVISMTPVVGQSTLMTFCRSLMLLTVMVIGNIGAVLLFSWGPVRPGL